MNIRTIRSDSPSPYLSVNRFPATFLDPTVELLQVILRQLVQRNAADLRDDVQTDTILVCFLCGGAYLWLE